MFTSRAAFAEINKVSDFNIILKEVYQSNKDTWVIFDVDDVLIMRKDQILNSNHNNELAKISGVVSTRITEADMKYLWSIVHLSSKSEIVDELIAQELVGIHNHVDHVIAFTNMGTGELGKITSVEDWRLNELQNFGIVFNTSLPSTAEKQLDCLLKKANPVCSPRFEVYFGSGGEMLELFHVINERVIADHICRDDCYKIQYEFSDNQFSIVYDVIGPNKRYIASTKFKRK